MPLSVRCFFIAVFSGKSAIIAMPHYFDGIKSKMGKLEEKRLPLWFLHPLGDRLTERRWSNALRHRTVPQERWSARIICL